MALDICTNCGGDKENSKCKFCTGPLTEEHDICNMPSHIKNSVIEYLWKLLDDIDTVNDWARDNNVAYRKNASRIANERWKTGITVSDDGQKIIYNHNKIVNVKRYNHEPEQENEDPKSYPTAG